MKTIIKKVLDEYARSNFYSDLLRNQVATEIEKRLIDDQTGKVIKTTGSNKSNKVSPNKKVDGETISDTVGNNSQKKQPVKPNKSNSKSGGINKQKVTRKNVKKPTVGRNKKR